MVESLILRIGFGRFWSMQTSEFSISGFKPRKHRVVRDKKAVLNGGFIKGKGMSRTFKASEDVRSYWRNQKREQRQAKVNEQKQS